MVPSASQSVGHDEATAARFTVHAIHSSPGFARLRRRSRRFTFIAGGAILAWFLLLFWAVGYQPEFMAREVAGHFTVGLLFAWSQVLTTVLAAYLFCRHARESRRATAEMFTRLGEEGDSHGSDAGR